MIIVVSGQIILMRVDANFQLIEVASDEQGCYETIDWITNDVFLTDSYFNKLFEQIRN